MPQISELFVTLGVKGSEKTIEAFTNIRSGVKGIASTSLEAKAAILGMLYTLERLSAGSIQRGTDLTKLSILIGKSTEELQKWQYAARQGSESNEDFASSLKSVYDKIEQLKISKSQPSGLNIFASAVGFDEKKAYSDILYVFKKAQEFVKTNVPRDIQNDVLKSFGFSEDAIVALRRQVFNDKNLKGAPILSEGQENQLAKTGVAVSNLENKVQMLFDRFTAAHGAQIVNDLSNIATQAFRIAEAFERISEKLKLFKLIGESFQGWDKLLSKIADKLEGKKDFFSDAEGQKRSAQEELDFWKQKQEVSQKNKDLREIPSSIVDYIKAAKLNINPQLDYNNFGFTDYSKGILKLFENNFLSPLATQSSTQNGTNNTSINQNLYFQHEGKDYGQIKNSVNESIVSAYKQLSAQSQVT